MNTLDEIFPPDSVLPQEEGIIVEIFSNPAVRKYLKLLGSNLSKDLPVYRDWETDRKSTRLNSSHSAKSRMPSSA